jgi:putative ABC transport system ATP-binding protein
MGLNIILKEVSKSFGNKEFSIRDINLKINSGEIVALVGDSGSGKTTLLNIIAGIDRPDSGSLVVGEENFDLMTEEALAKFRRFNLGFVFQSFRLIPHLNVHQNIAFPCLLQNMDMRSVKLKVASFIELIGLEGRDQSFPDQLSGGEQQRVAIARALIHEPKLILADEPTGNLDSTTTEKILNLLIDECNRSDATLIIVTHSEQVAKKIPKKLLLNSKGLSEINNKSNLYGSTT